MLIPKIDFALDNAHVVRRALGCAEQYERLNSDNTHILVEELQGSYFTPSKIVWNPYSPLP